MRVVHCKKEPYDVYIGRPSKWGNPFVNGEDGNRDAVIALYETWIRQQPDLMAALPELRGKTLGCWCAPQACHGDVLIRLVDEIEAPDFGPVEDPEIYWSHPSMWDPEDLW